MVTLAPTLAGCDFITEAAETSEDEDEATAALAGGKSLWTARVSKESRVRHGASLELSVDTRYL